jgi:hypothetical protein
MAYNIAKMLLWGLVFWEMTKEKKETPSKDIDRLEVTASGAVADILYRQGLL